MSWTPNPTAALCADLSFGHDAVTGPDLTRAGFSAVIGYVSQDPAKNATAADIASWRGAGLLVGLVYEDAAGWMGQGSGYGGAAGARARAQARAVGYPDECVIFAANDVITLTLQTEQTYAAFRAAVGPAGGYGARNYLLSLPDPDEMWQSNASSWSGGIRHPGACLLQMYADPRAQNMPIDVNEIQSPLTRFMGYAPPPPPPPEDLSMTPNIVLLTVDPATLPAGTPTPGEFVYFPNSGHLVHVEATEGGTNNIATFMAAGAVGPWPITYNQYLQLSGG